MNPNIVHVTWNNTPVGTLRRERGQITFNYTDAWPDYPSATALSTTMPLGTTHFGHNIVEPWLWGLLPDDPEVLRRWADHYDVPTSHPLGLLSVQGSDVPGAFTFTDPDRPHHKTENTITWLSEADVAARLAQLRVDRTAWLGTPINGRWSLAGAQAKCAFRSDGTGGWGLPTGTEPTTHIFKPAIAGLIDHDLNEHLCLTALAALGIPAAHSQVLTFDEERAIVVTRYDRSAHTTTSGDTSIHRVHQEDMCQALSISPVNKYESDGGPGIPSIVGVIRQQLPADLATAAVGTFLDATLINWLLLATDGHAKNYSLLLSGEQVRFAPLYDVASALPYPSTHQPSARLAMRIGGEYRAARIRQRHLERLAVSAHVSPDQVITRAVELSEHLPDALSQAAAQPDVISLGSALPQELVAKTAQWTADCIRQL